MDVTQGSCWDALGDGLSPASQVALGHGLVNQTRRLLPQHLGFWEDEVQQSCLLGRRRAGVGPARVGKGYSENQILSLKLDLY